MVKVRNTDRLQEKLVELVRVANEWGAIDIEWPYESRTVEDFVNLFTKASQEPLSREELTRFVKGIQAFVRLPVYTTELAAAWLGVGIDTMRTAIWRSDPPKLKTQKLGHDVLIEHGELVQFCEN